MAGVTLDGAGVEKMKTIEEATTQVQRLHGLVETYALAVKNSQSTSLYGMQVKRALFPLVGLLKPQFGMVADQVAALNLIATRGGSETAKIRVLREGVGGIRQALEIAVVRIKEHHAVKDAPEKSSGGPRTAV